MTWEPCFLLELFISLCDLEQVIGPLQRVQVLGLKDLRVEILIPPLANCISLSRLLYLSLLFVIYKVKVMIMSTWGLSKGLSERIR